MTTALTPKTLYDWYLEEQTTPTAGRLSPWQRRTLAVRFDGVRLGDHVLPPATDEDASEKKWEMDGSARALVSGDLDGLIRNMTIFRRRRRLGRLTSSPLSWTVGTLLSSTLASATRPTCSSPRG